MRIRILRPCSWAHQGLWVKGYAPGEVEADDPEFVRAALRHGWAEAVEVPEVPVADVGEAAPAAEGPAGAPEAPAAEIAAPAAPEARPRGRRKRAAGG